MKLYYSKGACSLAIRITLHELHFECEYESVDLKTKTTDSGANFLNINPKGSVPALELDTGEILTENVVIHQYLADKKPNNIFPPFGDFKRYRVMEWLSYIGADIHKTFSPLFYPQFSDETKNQFKSILKHKLSFVDNHLKVNQYLLSDQFTIADSYMFVMLFWLKKFKIEISDWQALSRYFSDLNARPSIKASLEEEDLKN